MDGSAAGRPFITGLLLTYSFPKDLRNVPSLGVPLWDGLAFKHKETWLDRSRSHGEDIPPGLCRR